MIGSLHPESRKVTVVGAGISGLLVAYYLDQAGYEVYLKEASSRVGGLIRTQPTPWGMSEAAAHSLLVTERVEALCQALGVPLLPVRPESQKRFIYRSGRLRTFPLSVREVLGALWRVLWRGAPPQLDPERLTLQQWGEHFLGRAVVRMLLAPMLKGIYGVRPQDVVVGAAFPALVIRPGDSVIRMLVRRHRSLSGPPAARRPVMKVPKGGMESLVRALERHLQERLGPKRFLLQTPEAPWGAHGASAPETLILTTPAPQAAALLQACDPVTAQALRTIQYTPMLNATVFLDPRAFQKGPPQGVGVLIPEGQPDVSILGVLFNSSSFEGRVHSESDAISVTAFLGGKIAPEFVHCSDEEVRAILKKDFATLLGYSGDLLGLILHRWDSAIPCYNAELMDAWQVARSRYCAQPGRILFGNYTGAVSIRGMVEDAARLAGF